MPMSVSSILGVSCPRAADEECSGCPPPSSRTRSVIFEMQILRSGVRVKADVRAKAVVIARVRGYAIGGGNVLAALCDLTIASENAIFGQVGPRMGSVDPGFGTAYLARIIGEKKYQGC